MSPDFSSIVHSQPFTFLVGSEHTKISIQSALAQHVSKPLHNLMNNGYTRESKHRIAVLEDEDVETFVAFCEYAYTGNYSVPKEERVITGIVESTSSVSSWRNSCRSDSVSSAVPPSAPTPPIGNIVETSEMAEEVKEEKEGAKDHSKSEHEDGEIDDFYPVESLHEDESGQPSTWDWTPSTSRKEKKQKKHRKGRELPPMEESVPAEEPVNLTPPSTPPPEAISEETAEVETAEPNSALEKDKEAESGAGEEQQAGDTPATEGPEEVEAGPEEEQKPLKPIIDMSFAKQSDFSPRTPGISLWEEFVSLKYNDEDNQVSFETPTNGYPYLKFHAKLYVFATRYLIPTLAQLCLRKLHHDLQHLSFDDSDEEVEEIALTEPNLHGDSASRQAAMVLNLLRYTYTNTTRMEPISPTSATQLRKNELRRLVTHYAACRVKNLAGRDESGDATPFNRDVKRADAGPKSLRGLLDQMPELASDLVYRMI